MPSEGNIVEGCLGIEATHSLSKASYLRRIITQSDRADQAPGEFH